MKAAFLFPGQGSQHVGMGRDLWDSFPEARRIFEAGNEMLGFSLTNLMFEEDSGENEPDAQLRETQNTQPALYLHSMAAFAVLQSKGVQPIATAGHSLGEYSALRSAGSVSFEEGLRMVRTRGELMAEAGYRRPGTMAAILNLDDETVSAICEEVSSDGSVVQPANFNSPGQVVISGDKSAVERAMQLATNRGARRVLPLAVSGAFHSPLMQYARDGLEAALNGITIRPPECPVYLNVTSSPTQDPDEIRKRLLEQLTAPVRWTQTMRRMHQDGISTFLEVGAGNVLTGLARRTLGKETVFITAGKADELSKLTASVH